MKKLHYLLILSVIFMYGCTEDSETLNFDIQKIDTSDGGVYAFNVDALGTPSKTDVNILETFNDRNNDMASARSDGNSSANGHFTTNEGNTVSFSSANNNGGNHGRFSISGVVNFKGDVLCSSIAGNQVLLQVLVTKLGEVPAGAEDAFAVGTSWFYLLEDNGEGSNAAADRYYTVALTAGLFDIPVCDFLPIADFLAIASGCPCDPQWSDVAGQGDQIQVK